MGSSTHNSLLSDLYRFLPRVDTVLELTNFCGWEQLPYGRWLPIYIDNQLMIN